MAPSSRAPTLPSTYKGLVEGVAGTAGNGQQPKWGWSSHLWRPAASFDRPASQKNTHHRRILRPARGGACYYKQFAPWR